MAACYIAELTFDGISCFQRIAMRDPVDIIRIYQSPTISPYSNKIGITPILIFKRKYEESMWNEQNGGICRYMFSHVQTESTDPVIHEGESMDIGFMEPDENVNLKKLTNKFRQGSDHIKTILKSYFRR